MSNMIQVLANKEDIVKCPIGTEYICVSKGGNTLRNVKAQDSLHYPEKVKYYEVDFENIEPLYPHPGLEVPEEGIRLKNDCGYLYCCGEFYFGWRFGTEDRILHYKGLNTDYFELEQPLPETKVICKDCGEEVCKCSIELKLIASLRFIQEKAGKSRENNLFARETDMYIENVLRSINPTPEVER